MRKIDRFDLYMKAKGLNDNKVTNMLNISVGVIGKSRKNGRDLSPRVIEKILQHFPDINKGWLLAGEGNMLITVNQTIKDRLILWIKHLGIGQAKFEKQCGLANGYVNNIRQTITPEKLQIISLHNPQLNTGWLMTGEGSMLKEEFSQNLKVLEDLEKIYKNKIESLEEKINMLNDTVATQKQIIEDQKWLIESLRSQVMRLEAKKTEPGSVCRPGTVAEGDSLSSPTNL